MGSCVSISDVPVQIFGYGHGAENGDWALNDCINYHEVGHALVAKLLPNFSSFILTSDGVKSDPGAMNEGWADYFASALCGVADYRVGTYHGRPNRSLKNELTCVDLVGEVHADGSVFAGGLWAVRESMPENLRTDFDKLILRALSLSGNDEQFSDQYNRILELLENSLNSTNAGLSNYTQLAREEFGKRVLGCTPVGTYTDSDTPTFFLPSARIVNDARDSERGPQISTVPAKVLIKARPADWAFSIKWNQLSSTVFGPSNLGYGKAPLRTFLSTGCEFKLQVSNASAPALDPDCPTARNIEMGVGRFEYTFAAEESHDVYMLFSHEHPSSISMQSAYFEFSGPQAMVRIMCHLTTSSNTLDALCDTYPSMHQCAYIPLPVCVSLGPSNQETQAFLRGEEIAANLSRMESRKRLPSHPPHTLHEWSACNGNWKRGGSASHYRHHTPLVHPSLEPVCACRHGYNDVCGYPQFWTLVQLCQAGSDIHQLQSDPGKLWCFLGWLAFSPGCRDTV